MKKIFKFALALIAVLCFAQNISAQGCLVLEYRNVVPTGCTSGSDTFSGFTFEVWASAASCYSGTMDDWLAMNIRIDATVGDNNIQSITNTPDPTNTSSSGGQVAVPGAPPAGSSELGLTYSREAFQPELTATPVLLGTVSVALVNPISSTVSLVSRTATSSTGTFYANVDNVGIRLDIEEPGAISVISCAALPVTLINFQAKKEEGKAILNWETTSETNSDYFEIEQSVNGKNWYSLGTISSAGESTTNMKYEFIDASPFEGENLYRLRMVDKDGTFAYSRIVSVSFDYTSKVATYPNPAKDRIDIKGVEISKISNVVFLSVDGKELLSSKQTSGIDISSLSSGIYLAKIFRNDGLFYICKVVVNK